jgi:hypothetical protein
MAQTYRETREREEDGLQFDLKAMEENPPRVPRTRLPTARAWESICQLLSKRNFLLLTILCPFRLRVCQCQAICPAITLCDLLYSCSASSCFICFSHGPSQGSRLPMARACYVRGTTISLSALAVGARYELLAELGCRLGIVSVELIAMPLGDPRFCGRSSGTYISQSILQIYLQ